jgi:hypothetical protein
MRTSPAHEMAALLAEALLALILSERDSQRGSSEKPLISGSQPAPLCADGGAEKPGPIREEATE